MSPGCCHPPGLQLQHQRRAPARQGPCAILAPGIALGCSALGTAPPAGTEPPVAVRPCTPRPALPAPGPGLPDSRQREKQLVRKPKGGSWLQVGGRKRVLKIQQRLHGPRRWLSRWRVSAATWAPADGTRGSPLCAPSLGLLGGGEMGKGRCGASGKEGPRAWGCSNAVPWGHRLRDRAGSSGVSPAGFAAPLPSGCSMGPRGMASVVWVLQGDEGKPQHRADAPGERATRLQTTAPTQQGRRAPSQGCTLEGRHCSCPQQASAPDPHPASQRCCGWSQLHPTHPGDARVPPARAEQPGRVGPWAPSCLLHRAGGFPSVFRALASSAFISGRRGSRRPRWAQHHQLGVLPSRPAVRVRRACNERWKAHGGLNGSGGCWGVSCGSKSKPEGFGAGQENPTQL